MNSDTQVLHVWGPLACYSRPELKVERFSYPCITPSAARGIFDSIYLKPTEFRWQITKIEILSPPRYIALRRNEVKEKVNVTAVGAWMDGRRDVEPIWADGSRDITGSDEQGRTQRQTMALKDVAYHLHARIVPWPGFESMLPALEAQFRRRASQGKCFQQPYFGCREFPAYFELVDEDNRRTAEKIDLDLGLMLYDVFDLSRPGAPTDSPSISLFRAKIEQGVLEVPEYEDDDVLRGQARGI